MQEQQTAKIKIAIISGRSGSGKTTALHVLEDVGYYCIDNLPAGLLPDLLSHTLVNPSVEYQRIAVCIDARNAIDNLQKFTSVLEEFPAQVETDIIYLDANNDELIKRFSETRRKHPLSSKFVALQEALEAEKEILAPIANGATLTIETSRMNIYELREIVRQRVVGDDSGTMAIMFESFGFKRGVPNDADMVFDVRCLPNPYWNKPLRSQTGLDDDVIAFLETQEKVNEMFNDISDFLAKWLPTFEANNRSYITVAIGCTGGQHRSVYMSERLMVHFYQLYSNVQVRHRELKQTAVSA